MGEEHTQRGDAGQRMIRVQRGTEHNGARFHDTTQNNMQFKTHEILNSGIVYLIFSDRG